MAKIKALFYLLILYVIYQILVGIANLFTIIGDSLMTIGVFLSCFGMFFIFVASLYLIYEYFYFKSEKFLYIKEKVNSHIIECNDFNEYIENLKSSYLNIRYDNYGTTQGSDNSRYNFSRRHWSDFRKDDRTHHCSLSVLSNFRIHTIKYFCKYFDVSPSIETLEKFQQLLNNFISVEQGKILLQNKKEEILESIKSNVPYIITIISKNKLSKKLGFLPVDLSDEYYPVYTFKYISPGGNKCESESLFLNIPNLQDLVFFLNDKIKFIKSVYGQRLLMTPSLREEIKLRDEHKCMCCGLSTKEEKNLLLEIDHIMPLSRGGLTIRENLQTLCWKCNRSKGNKVI
jgi:hypothetical protein